MVAAGNDSVPEGWPPPSGGKGRSGGGGLPFPPGKLLLPAIFLILVVIVAVAFVTGEGGVIDVADTEVAVIINYLTGGEELVTTPGLVIFIPWLQQAYLFDKSPNEFVMEGQQDRSFNHVRELTVRAKDGSSFRFDTLTIQYQLLPSRTADVLNDSGDGEAFKRNWLRASARSILRDEFGKYSSDEIADPSSYELAVAAATERLDGVLESHGIDVTQVIIPRPKFDKVVEDAIDNRKNANQEVQRLGIEIEKLTFVRQRTLAQVERDKAEDFEQVLGILEADRITAEKDRIRTVKNADAQKITDSNDGNATEQANLQEARALEEKARKDAEGLTARVTALEERGEILVREKLAEKYAGIRFSIVPYRRDPAPIRIEHLGASGPLPPSRPVSATGGSSR
ncbi:MAG: SPFH domain-containing protein [Planctomycetota bacterium]|nr:SPFH domain-containing protein [Planctomycetota bacterium]